MCVRGMTDRSQAWQCQSSVLSVQLNFIIKITPLVNYSDAAMLVSLVRRVRQQWRGHHPSHEEKIKTETISSILGIHCSHIACMKTNIALNEPAPYPCTNRCPRIAQSFKNFSKVGTSHSMDRSGLFTPVMMLVSHVLMRLAAIDWQASHSSNLTCPPTLKPAESPAHYPPKWMSH